MKINSIEMRQQSPLQFDQILSRGAVKRALVTVPQPQSFDSRRKIRSRAITNFRKSLLGSLEVDGRNQKVEIRKAAQAEIAVKRLRQHRPFVGDHPQLPAPEVLHDARQFDCEPQAAPQVRLVCRAQRALDFRWKAANMFDQVAGRERKNSVVFSQTQNFAPVERGAIPIRNALDPLRNQLRASQRAQELKFVPSLRRTSRRGRQKQEFSHGSGFQKNRQATASQNKRIANRHYNTESSACVRSF